MTPDQQQEHCEHFNVCKMYQGFPCKHVDPLFHCSDDTRTRLASLATPCEENGCTDIENCDEICEHQRIYSQAWLREHDAAIRNAMLDEVIAFCKSNDCVQKTHGDVDCKSTTDSECVICFCESLRSSTVITPQQQERKE